MLVLRKVDELGRIVIPRELRRTLNINEKNPLEIYVERDKIILKKYIVNMACNITGEISEANEIFWDGNLILSPKGKRC
ncbi:AbrB/MazE/SpoVT family DNA-binding domain-containing protein [Alkalihalobacillus alcalophilus]|uniref:AbrB/MazE/SpoVT family DNA-binding domain-containing protein n=1 Tax=Alkalihalobacillus alcalophilus TaxID=1445 RepID=UPI0009E07149|nr:AbrB/MazE/SpoVT family DNA-binding domain-containing protein [Alkalihalobacillus alcalophilus]MED1563625.1 AbrB/MazE/SpoVT family DNA-binding domain-containing protein [Alkalihalobacillus alcalophilus]